ncbi:hypothetical protein GCM10011514_16630 [Emticicia aquatilis]|uniref:Nucleoid-associated protein n=1 Tax=Emticicia aquatilis TaxID=1537369 RepID=A0A916YNI8_9BACT|nr:nucleoid-associated protein [Emticicia aquatilis]GGD53190.1 hypothetical protein GCM10011514_16630 [Emticicia aquatilis]
MIKLLASKLESSAVHFIGNKNNDERLILTKKPIDIQDIELKNVLNRFFTNQFNGKEELFRFNHSSDLSLNEIYSYVTDIFDNPNSLHFNSVKIAKFLYEKTLHPKIKSGELYIGFLKDCVVEGEVVDGVCIFKCESKTTFLTVNQEENELKVSYNSSGVNIEKTDKACIIFNVKKEEGYKICITDNTNKSVDAQYWKESFLNVENISNSYFQTDSMMGIYRSFINEEFSNKDKFPKTEKIELINRSVEYFKNEEKFQIEDFAEKVLQSRDLIESFRTYREVQPTNDKIVDEFNISGSAFKKQSRKLKSVLKLDSNFHIYIHGNNEMIEHGVDEKTGRKFYKIYYDVES